MEYGFEKALKLEKDWDWCSRIHEQSFIGVREIIVEAQIYPQD